MLVQKESQMIIDNWGQLDDGTYWQQMAPTDVFGFRMGVSDQIYISEREGFWRLRAEGDPVSTAHATLAEAKAIGSKRVEGGFDRIYDLIIAELGFPVEDWDILLDAGTIVISSRKNPDITLLGLLNWNVWIADRDNEEFARSEDFDEMLVAAQAAVASSLPSA